MENRNKTLIDLVRIELCLLLMTKWYWSKVYVPITPDGASVYAALYRTQQVLYNHIEKYKL